MRVDLIAAPIFMAGSRTPYTLHDPAQGQQVKAADEMAEFAGRGCYQSWHRPNPATATNGAYLANILAMGHESVLEHAHFVFYVTGVSRALTHELIRHRHLSFSELSQRFVDVSEADYVVPPAIRNHDGDPADGMSGVLGDAVSAARSSYETLVQFLTMNGAKRKQAREAARAVMPNCTTTALTVSGNLRAWRDVLKKRWHVAADAEIREFAGEVLENLRLQAPNSMQDIPEEPYDT